MFKAISNPPFSVPKISLQLGPDSTSLVELFKNEVVEGKVLKSPALDTALLLIKGRRVMARTYVPLREGRVLSLKVEEISPTPTLRLLGIKLPDKGAVDISIVLSAIKENPWRSLFENIHHYGLPKEALSLFRELMNDLSLRLFLNPPPELLRIFIEKSGLSWEAKLKKLLINKKIGGDNLNRLIEGDLKGMVSRFLALKEEKGVFLKRFLSTTKSTQLLNRFGLEQDRKIFLPIPIQFPNGPFTVGQLLIHLPQKGKDGYRRQKIGKEPFRITFLLDLSNLGPLRADVTVKAKEIEGKFLLTREEAKLLIEESIPIFINRMKERGFSVRCIECHLKDHEIVKESLIKEIIQEEGNTISLVV
jgi:hypothetical protein